MNAGKLAQPPGLARLYHGSTAPQMIDHSQAQRCTKVNRSVSLGTLWSLLLHPH